jgi:hypothetical protein
MKGGESTLQGWRLAAVVLAALALIWCPVPAPAATNQAVDVVGDEIRGSVSQQTGDRSAMAVTPNKIRENLVSDVLPGRLLFDNGPLVNSPGTGAGGADESVLQNISLGMTSYGFNNSVASGFRVADDFEVTDGKWNITYIRFNSYQTGYILSENSPIIGAYFQIWDGPPNNPASKVVWGDLTTNRLNSWYGDWMHAYRVLETTSGATNRAILTSVATIEKSANMGIPYISLPRGTYWLDWMMDGNPSFTGPWVPPITVTGQTTTGNAMQYQSGTGEWMNLVDVGQQGLPFKIYGTSFSWIMLNPPTTGAGIR